MAASLQSFIAVRELNTHLVQINILTTDDIFAPDRMAVSVIVDLQFGKIYQARSLLSHR